MNQESPLPTSVLAHITGACFGAVGTVASIWWLNKNPMELSSGLLTALTIVFILFLALFITVHGISHAYMEKNYGIDPMRGLEWE